MVAEDTVEGPFVPEAVDETRGCSQAMGRRLKQERTVPSFSAIEKGPAEAKMLVILPVLTNSRE